LDLTRNGGADRAVEARRLLARAGGLVAAVLATAYVVWWRPARELAEGGKPLNQRAWESTYTERGRAVPPSGP